jgi:hypothetical protein
MTWIATVITVNGVTLLVWWLRLHWQAHQERSHRQDLIALARALPSGGEIHERHSNGTWTILAVTRDGDDDSDFR